MCCFLFTRQPSAICARPLIILMSFLPALQSTFSSSRLCWFTTATCTQDISSRTAAAPPRLPQPSARSGCGCRTTRCEKPACTRCCLPTRTCSSTRESEDWTSLCARRSDRKLPASQPADFSLFRSDCHSCTSVTNSWILTLWRREQSYCRADDASWSIMKVITVSY